MTPHCNGPESDGQYFFFGVTIATTRPAAGATSVTLELTRLLQGPPATRFARPRAALLNRVSRSAAAL